MFSEKSSSEGDDEQVEDFDLEKSNIMVFGPTGSGKTHIIKVRSMKKFKVRVLRRIMLLLFSATFNVLPSR